MIRAAVIAAMLASPATAQERAAWGFPTAEGGQSSVRIERVLHGPEIARIVAVNRRTIGAMRDLSMMLVLQGLPVRVDVMQGDGDAPDVYHAIPPEGIIAVPDHVTVPEGGEAVMLLFVAADMVMG